MFSQRPLDYFQNLKILRTDKDRHLKLYPSNKTANINGKNCKCKGDKVIALKRHRKK